LLLATVVIVVAGLVPAATRADLPIVPPDPCDELLGGMPLNTNPPDLTGDPAVGEELTTSNGAWIVCADPVTHYTYRWLRDNVPIPGATASTYTVAFEDAEHEIRPEVTAWNVNGGKSALSNAVVIQDEPSPTEEPFFSDQEPVEPPDPDPTDSDDPDASDDEGAFGAMASGAEPVNWSQNAHVIKFTNADATWWIYKLCFDRPSGGRRFAVGPGYIARVTRNANSTTYVNDYRGRVQVAGEPNSGPSSSPGLINEVEGGLGTFGWHNSRGQIENSPAGDDPTTTQIEPVIGQPQPRPGERHVVEGRICADAYDGYGAHGRSVGQPERVTETVNGVTRKSVRYTFDVFLRDQYGNTGHGKNGHSLARVRYRYSFYRSSVQVWMSVLLYPRNDTEGVPFAEEPKFTAMIRGGYTPKPNNPNYTRMTVFGGTQGTDFQKGIMRGAPECIGQTNPPCSLLTEHSADPDRRRVRWDYGTRILRTDELPDVPGCSTARPCFNAVMRAYPTTSTGDVLRDRPAFNWEGAGYGLDRWAVLSAQRPKRYPRDTRAGGGVATCGVNPGGPIVDQNGNGTDDETSVFSEAASPGADGQREWEHGGWKASAPGEPERNPNTYTASFTFFNGWEDERGPEDCEPLARAFKTEQESWGAFASYSLNDGWVLEP
jgi:hypothetical protein